MRDSPVAPLTGASRGIGLWLANRFRERGHTVVGCSRTGSDGRWSFEAHAIDVGDEPAVRGLVADIAKRHGRLDVLVNNVGIFSSAAALLTTHEMLDGLLRTNFVGAFVVAREAAKLMGRQRGGRIVSIASDAVVLSMPGPAAYGATKAASSNP